MATTTEQLTGKKCVPCEGGIPRLTTEQAGEMLAAVPGWEIVQGGERIRREWVVRNFKAGMAFFTRITDLAEAEGHHPDLHLVGYRNVAIELWTHAIGGLSENDFVLAAKIDQIPVATKQSPTRVDPAT